MLETYQNRNVICLKRSLVTAIDENRLFILKILNVEECYKIYDNFKSLISNNVGMKLTVENALCLR